MFYGPKDVRSIEVRLYSEISFLRRVGGGGGGVVGGGGVTSYIWHSTVVRAKWPLFQRCQVYNWPPFFNKKYMNDPIFLDSYVKASPTPTPFLTSWYIHILYSLLSDFSRLFFLLVFNELTAIFFLLPAVNGYQKSKGSIWIGQHLGWSSIWVSPFFQRLGIWMG